MSIRKRVEDALHLWTAGRREGAWLGGLVAAAATAKKRYPKKKDREAFSLFVMDITPTLMTGGPSPVNGGGVRVAFGAPPPDSIYLDDLMYKHFRCTFLHEAKLPDNLFITESKLIDGKLSGALVVEIGKVGIPDFYVLNLIKAIVDAPENEDEFKDFTGFINK